MDFFYKNNTVTIESDKKVIEFLPWSVILDGLTLEMPWEYEKWGFLAYAQEENEALVFQIMIEGYHIWFIPSFMPDLSSATLDFLWDIDVLILFAKKESTVIIEKIEPRLVIAYWENAHDLAIHMWVSEPATQKYRLKEADLSLDKAWCIVMGD